jgi:beta-glucosidase
MKFPKHFYWGAATASYQVEGGIENNDWAQAAREGRVPSCGRACDHYNRYEEDFDIARELGHNAHRFSIEWARIEPKEGQFDQKEIEHYRQVLQALKERNLTPFVTLWHFTLPVWFSESGGWQRKDAPEIFARYCSKVVAEMGDLATHYATLNEPNVYATHTNLYGAWPPFKRARLFWLKVGKEDGTSEMTGAKARFWHFFSYLKVANQLARAHRTAYNEIKLVRPEAQISVVKHVHYFHGNGGRQNFLLAKIMFYLQTARYLNQIADCLDEIGINYYRNTGYGETREYKLTDMGWKMAPAFIYEVIMQLTRYGKPMYIAEAGLADQDDSDRGLYIWAQTRAVGRAIEAGADVRGHFYWSLMDNYEWSLGFEIEFGLIHINYQTLERTIRPSAYVYKEIIENNGIVE